MASDVAEGVQKVAKRMQFFVGVVFQDVREILSLSMVGFDPIDAFVMHFAFDDIGSIEFTHDFEQFITIELP